MGDPPLSPVELLTASHDVASFDCGRQELTDWLARHAFASHQAGSARVFVVQRGGQVVAYYALATGAVDRADAPLRVAKGLANHEIPVILLARFAVDTHEQGRGLGAALLKDAMQRVASAAEEIGVRALLVHAKDEEARAFYEHFDFEASPSDPLHLFLLLKDIRASLG